MPPIFKSDGTGGCLNVDDGRNYFGRFMSAIVGNRAHRDRERRAENWSQFVLSGQFIQRSPRPRRLFGSRLHLWHLLNGHFRSNSFMVKIGMDSPTPGLPFKWNAILRSDQQVSSRGMSSFRVMLKTFFGGSGFWSLVMTEEHEGAMGAVA